MGGGGFGPSWGYSPSRAIIFLDQNGWNLKSSKSGFLLYNFGTLLFHDNNGVF